MSQHKMNSVSYWALLARAALGKVPGSYCHAVTRQRVPGQNLLNLIFDAYLNQRRNHTEFSSSRISELLSESGLLSFHTVMQAKHAHSVYSRASLRTQWGLFYGYKPFLLFEFGNRDLEYWVLNRKIIKNTYSNKSSFLLKKQTNLVVILLIK